MRWPARAAQVERDGFNRMQGSGTWVGTGPSGICSGIWTAIRF